MARLVATRTLDKYERDYYPKRDRITISFRGDLAEQYNYDKIQPLSEAQRHGHKVVIEATSRSEEHTSELQSPCNLVCRLLLEKKKIEYHSDTYTQLRHTSQHISVLYSIHSY